MSIRSKHIYRFKSIKIIFLCFLLPFIMLNSCVETFDGFDDEVGEFANALVIEAIITNELKHQEVLLSRSYSFGNNETVPEQNAIVTINDGNGSIIEFKEDKPGIYLSIDLFSAELNKDYELLVTTESGETYASDKMQLPTASTNIDNLYAERLPNSNGEDGMNIFIDSFDPQGNSKYYRYEYEETYKIIAPLWSPYDAVLLGEGIDRIYLNVILREREERLCYGTDNTKDIIIHNTVALSEDRVSRLNIRFIKSDNYILTYRYSILVKQFVQSPQAHFYYETLKGQSSSENLFSENQPGFIVGNVFSTQDENENVVGFFEVAAVAEKRIFFDYEDFYPGEPAPPYLKFCNPTAPSDEQPIGSRPLAHVLRDNTMRYYGPNRNPGPGEGPLLMVRPECGDCTVLGSNKKPDFWVE